VLGGRDVILPRSREAREGVERHGNRSERYDARVVGDRCVRIFEAHFGDLRSLRPKIRGAHGIFGRLSERSLIRQERGELAMTTLVDPHQLGHGLRVSRLFSEIGEERADCVFGLSEGHLQPCRLKTERDPRSGVRDDLDLPLAQGEELVVARERGVERNELDRCVFVARVFVEEVLIQMNGAIGVAQPIDRDTRCLMTHRATGLLVEG
jgi:hypothetical protein